MFKVPKMVMEFFTFSWLLGQQEVLLIVELKSVWKSAMELFHPFFNLYMSSKMVH